MEDVRLGRALAPQINIIVAADSTDTPVCEANPNRTRIVFGVNADAPVYVYPGRNVASAQRGFLLNTTVPRMTVLVEEWGKIVQMPWFAAGFGSAVPVAVMEATLEKQ